MTIWLDLIIPRQNLGRVNFPFDLSAVHNVDTVFVSFIYFQAKVNQPQLSMLLTCGHRGINDFLLFVFSLCIYTACG